MLNKQIMLGLATTFCLSMFVGCSKQETIEVEVPAINELVVEEVEREEELLNVEEQFEEEMVSEEVFASDEQVSEAIMNLIFGEEKATEMGYSFVAEERVELTNDSEYSDVLENFSLNHIDYLASSSRILGLGDDFDNANLITEKIIANINLDLFKTNLDYAEYGIILFESYDGLCTIGIEEAELYTLLLDISEDKEEVASIFYQLAAISMYPYLDPYLYFLMDGNSAVLDVVYSDLFFHGVSIMQSDECIIEDDGDTMLSFNPQEIWIEFIGEYFDAFTIVVITDESASPEVIKARNKIMQSLQFIL